MEAKAHLKYLRISPRKVSILCDIIRGKDAKTACVYLMQTPKAASEPMLKLLKSAIANAENNNGMDVDKLVVTTAVANPGPILKRGRATARGRYSLPYNFIYPASPASPARGPDTPAWRGRPRCCGWRAAAGPPARSFALFVP